MVQANKLRSKVIEGSDTRHGGQPVQAVEASRIRPAKTNQASEARPKFEATPVVPARHQALIVEPNQVITVIQVKRGAEQEEYRKVVRKYSGTFYFKNGESCTKVIFESEALADLH